MRFSRRPAQHLADPVREQDICMDAGDILHVIAELLAGDGGVVGPGHPLQYRKRGGRPGSDRRRVGDIRPIGHAVGARCPHISHHVRHLPRAAATRASYRCTRQVIRPALRRRIPTGAPPSGALGPNDRGGVPMPEALILEFPGLTEADYAAVNKQLGIDTRPARGTGLPRRSGTPPEPRTTGTSSCRRCGHPAPTRRRSWRPGWARR